MKKSPLVLRLLMAIAVLTLAFSCKKESVSKKLPATSSIDSNFVTLDMAIIAAQQAPNSHLTASAIKGKTVNALTGEATKDVLDYASYPNATKPSVYVINYKDGGFVVVAADRRVEPILAFADKGYFSLASQLPAGITGWLDVNNRNMEVLRKSVMLTAPKLVKNLWSELKVPVAKGSTKVIDVAQPPPPPCQPTYSQQQVGPLLTTTWAQGNPYNQDSYIPAGTYSFGAGKDPVGCVATAMAQVLYFWKKPTSYNWTIMPTNSNTYTTAGKTEVSRLMANIGRSVGMVYASSGSHPSSTSTSVTANGLKSSYFGLTSATGANYDNSTSYFTVMSNLNSHWPVILSGATSTDGHEWVCDGYWQISSTWCPDGNGNPGGGETVLYFDMNWGWNEAGVSNVDGWFDFNYWSVMNGPTQEVFSHQLEYTYNIHP